MNLTMRELEILQFVSGGFQNQEIAKELEIAENTVKSHLKNICRKLGAENRAHAVAIGLRERLIR